MYIYVFCQVIKEIVQLHITICIKFIVTSPPPKGMNIEPSNKDGNIHKSKCVSFRNMSTDIGTAFELENLRKGVGHWAVYYNSLQSFIIFVGLTTLEILLNFYWLVH